MLKNTEGRSLDVGCAFGTNQNQEELHASEITDTCQRYGEVVLGCGGDCDLNSERDFALAVVGDTGQGYGILIDIVMNFSESDGVGVAATGCGE